MKISKNITIAGLLISSFYATSASAYTISGGALNDGSWTDWVGGQTFNTAVGATPDPGAVSTVNLESLSFYLGADSGAGIGANDGQGDTETIVEIHTSALTDPFSAATLVGASTNILDTAGGTTGDEFEFTFGGLELDYNTNYVALFKTNGGTLGQLSLLGGNHHDDYAGGGFFWAANSFNFASTPSANDLVFDAVFSTAAVPVPAAAWLFGSAILGLAGVSRSRKS